MTHPDDPLHLQAWKAGVVPPARFSSEVWGRIASRAPARRGSLEGWVEALALLLPRPACALALVTACIGLGLGFGYTAAGHARSAGLQTGRALYAASINPLAHASSSLE